MPQNRTQEKSGESDGDVLFNETAPETENVVVEASSDVICRSTVNEQTMPQTAYKLRWEEFVDDIETAYQAPFKD